MDLSKSDIAFVDTKSKLDDNYLQKLNETNQKLIYYENEKNEVMQSNCKSSETVSSDMAENNVVDMDYTVALSHKFNEKEDVMHLTNTCAAMYSRENEYQYILKENNELKYALSKQRILVLNHYDEILNSLSILKQELEIKDLKISQLEDDINLLKTKNEEQNSITEIIGIKEFSYDLGGEYLNGLLDDSQNRNELNEEGKLLIAEEINQLGGSSDIIRNVESYRMPDLISMFINIVREKTEYFEKIISNLSQYVEDHNQLLKEIDNYKEWQERLESENGRLNIEIDNYKFDRTMFISKEHEYNDLKKEYSQTQYAYDEMCKKCARLESLVKQYKEEFTKKEINCADNENVIKILNLNVSELTNKLKLTMIMYKNEQEKFKKHESYVQQMVEEFTDKIQEKNMEIISVQDECSILKQNTYSAEEEIQNLRNNVVTLEYVLRNKKNETEQKNKKEQQSLLQFNDLLHILSVLEQQMSIMLDDMSTCKKKIVSYENMLHNIQNAIQQQSITRDRWASNHENIKKKYNKLMENEMKKKQETLLEHQIKVNNLKKDHNLRITSLADTEIILRYEIQDLKKNLNKKNSFLIMAEKLASLQLYDAYDQINNLTHISTTQELEIREMKKHIAKMQLVKHIPNTDTRLQLYRECYIDLMKKLKLKVKILKHQCKIRDERIKYLQNNSTCTSNYSTRCIKQF